MILQYSANTLINIFVLKFAETIVAKASLDIALGKRVLYSLGCHLQMYAYRLLDRNWRDGFRTDNAKY